MAACQLDKQISSDVAFEKPLQNPGKYLPSLSEDQESSEVSRPVDPAISLCFNLTDLEVSR